MNSSMRSTRKPTMTWKITHQLDVEMVQFGGRRRDEQAVRNYPEFTNCHRPTQLLGIDAIPVKFFDLLFPEQHCLVSFV